MQITFGEAVNIISTEKLMSDNGAPLTVAAFAAKFGFEVVAGTANVEAVAAKPAIESNPERVAAAALLFEAGVKRKATGTGRPRRTLGTAEGTYPYNISVSIDPDYKA